MRKLRHHERRLLKKVDFLSWRSDHGHRDVRVMRRYHVQDRDDYQRYNLVCGQIKRFVHQVSLLPPDDPVRRRHETRLLEKLYDLGLVPARIKVSEIETKLSVSAFCRRRIGVVMQRLKLAETVSAAVRYVEQGHVRIGPNVVRDPAYLVSRSVEDYLTWTDSSKIKRKVMQYNDKLDDYDLL